MPSTSPNRLLASLAPAEFELLRPHLKPTELKHAAVLFEAGDKIDRVYFPHSGIISLVVELAGGEAIEAAMIGRDSAALIAGTPWLDINCPGCGTSRALDLRKVDRHPLASVGTLVLGLRCSWCPGSAPMPKIPGLYAPSGCGRSQSGHVV